MSSRDLSTPSGLNLKKKWYNIDSSKKTDDHNYTSDRKSKTKVLKYRIKTIRK